MPCSSRRVAIGALTYDSVVAPGSVFFGKPQGDFLCFIGQLRSTEFTRLFLAMVMMFGTQFAMPP